MAQSLLDLGPLTEEVAVRGIKLEVHGLTLKNLFKLFSQFPNMQELVAKAGGINAAMIELAPGLFAKVIAIATGNEGNEEVEAKAEQLSAAEQLEIMMAVQRLTAPQGFVPFVNQMTRMLGTDTTQSASSTKPGNSSQPPLSAELQTDSPGMMRGASPRAN